MEDLKAKLALQEVELHHRNRDTEALISKIAQQTDKLNKERDVADAEEQRVGHLHRRNTFCKREGSNERSLHICAGSSDPG